MQICAETIFTFTIFLSHTDRYNCLVVFMACCRSSQKSGELASQIPLIAGKGKRDTSLAPSMVGQPCGVTTCCCENESPSDGDSKTNGSLCHGHTYQTRKDTFGIWNLFFADYFIKLQEYGV